jgi:hypothetical protein
MNVRFKNFHDASKPSDEFKKRLWQRLEAEMPAMTKRSIVIRYGYVVGLTSVVMMTGGMGTYAYASDNVTPDSSLYGVKIGIESVEARLYRSPESLAVFHARMAHRRNRELDHVRSPEARAIVEDDLKIMLRTTAQDLEGSTVRMEMRADIETDMNEIHELRFREQAETYYNEMHNRVDRYEIQGELNQQDATELRNLFLNKDERVIFKVEANEKELEKRRIDSIYR